MRNESRTAARRERKERLRSFARIRNEPHSERTAAHLVNEIIFCGFTGDLRKHPRRVEGHKEGE
jgi:hypothetical protein